MDGGRLFPVFSPFSFIPFSSCFLSSSLSLCIITLPVLCSIWLNEVGAMSCCCFYVYFHLCPPLAAACEVQTIVLLVHTGERFSPSSFTKSVLSLEDMAS